MNCYMCGAPPCPNNPDGDGVGNWDAFDGLIIPDAAGRKALLSSAAWSAEVTSLLRELADGRYSISGDEHEQGLLLQKLEAAASRLLDFRMSAEGGAA